MAKLEDKRSVWDIYLSTIVGSANPNDDYLDELIKKGGVLVAERDGEIIGFGGIDVEETEQVKYLYILPEHQRSGAGTKILMELEEIGWQIGLESLRLHSSPVAVEFYRGQGYRAVEEADHIAHDHEGVEMIKRKI